MAKFAKVESLDALKELRTFLCHLASKITLSIEDAEYDLQNTVNWLKQDQSPYWKSQVNKRKEEFMRAKLELKRKQYLEKPSMGGSYSHIDQKKALAIAQSRFEQAESKLKKVHHWIPILEKQMHECRTTLQGLSNLIQIDLSKKRTQIDQMIYSLESYMDVTVPELEVSSAMAALDSHDDMSKPAKQKKEEPSENMPDLYKRLHDRNPFNKLTNEICFRNSEIKLFDIKNSDKALDVMDKYKTEDQWAGENATIIVDDRVISSNFIFVEIVAVGKKRKANIYIAPVESIDLTSCSAYTMTDYLQWNPTWHDLFLLPEDWIILFKNGWVANIFNSDKNLIYKMCDHSI